MSITFAAVLGATALSNNFVRHAGEHHHGVAVLAVLAEQAETLHSYELKAGAESAISPGLREEANRLYEEMDKTLEDASHYEPEEADFQRVADMYRQYTTALEKHFSLISEGRIAEAQSLDMQLVDPVYFSFKDAIADSMALHHRQAEEKAWTSYLASLGVALSAVVAIGLIFWRFDRARRAAQEALAEKQLLSFSEERFRSLAQSATDGFISADSEGKIIFWNEAAERLFGYAAEEALGKPVTMIIPERLREVHKESYRRIVRGGETGSSGTTFETSARKRDGAEFPIELSISGWQLREKNYFTAIIRDISVRKEAEEQIQRKSEEVSLRNRELSVLYKVSYLASHTMSQDDLLHFSLKTVMELGLLHELKRCGIMLLEGEKLRLAAVEGEGFTQDFLNVHADLKLGDCLCGRAAQQGEIIVSKDSLKDIDHTLTYAGEVSHGNVVVPLKARSKVVGVLFLQTETNAEVDERQLLLLRAIGDHLGVAIDNVRLYEKTKALSLHDPLTGLANRNLMHIELKEAFAMARRFDRAFSVIMMDLDLFKDYNDSYGHAAGDKLLVETARVILRNIREIDLAVRYGGEEFLVILPEADAAGAHDVAERIRMEIMATDHFPSDSAAPVHITISGGVATYDRDLANAGDLVERADKALYESKKRGRNQVTSWPFNGRNLRVAG